MNYFRFDVVSDIKVVMPEEVSDNNVLNVCFKYYEVMNFEQFMNMLVKYNISGTNLFEEQAALDKKILIKDIFKITLDADQIFSKPNNDSLDITKLILLRLVCYRIDDMNVTKYINVKQDDLDNVTMATISYTPKIKMIDRERMQFVTEIRKRNISSCVLIRFNAYSITKLSWPYVDECANYTDLGFINRNDAVNHCTNERKIARDGAIYRGISQKNNSKYVDYRFAGNVDVYDRDKFMCKIKYDAYDDCFKETIFTQVIINDAPTMNNQPTISLEVDDSTLPSYKIRSKPMINDIDFLTFIFGALGSWLGFSFLLINPIPHLFKVNDMDCQKRHRSPEHSEFKRVPQAQNYQLMNRLSVEERRSEIMYHKMFRMEVALSKISYRMNQL